MHFTSDKRSWRLSHVVSKDRPFTTSEETWLENGPKHLAQKATVRYMERYGGKSWRWHGHTIVVQRSSTCLFFWTLFLDFVGWMMPLPSCTYLVISRVLDTSEANIMVFSMSFSSHEATPSWHAETCLNFKIWLHNMVVLAPALTDSCGAVLGLAIPQIAKDLLGPSPGRAQDWVWGRPKIGNIFTNIFINIYIDIYIAEKTENTMIKMCFCVSVPIIWSICRLLNR